MLLDFGQRSRMDALGIFEVIQPTEKSANIIADNCARLAVYEDVGIEQDPHGLKRLSWNWEGYTATARAWHAQAERKRDSMQLALHTPSRIRNQEKCAQKRFIFRGSPLGALNHHVNKNREALLFRLPCDYRLFCGGSDETRTRDLRRDRPAFYPS